MSFPPPRTITILPSWSKLADDLIVPRVGRLQGGLRDHVAQVEDPDRVQRGGFRHPVERAADFRRREPGPDAAPGCARRLRPAGSDDHDLAFREMLPRTDDRFAHPDVVRSLRV